MRTKGTPKDASASEPFSNSIGTSSAPEETNRTLIDASIAFT
jgi:hypothetical protein